MREPDGLKRLIRELSSTMGFERALDVGKIFSSWEELVGVDIALKCRPKRLQGGVLVVETASSAWAAQLRYLGPKIAEALNRATGNESVKQVKAVVAAREQLEPRTERQANDRLPHRVEPTQKEIEEAEEIISEIPDRRLADAAKRALLAAKMQKKREGSRGTI